MWLLAWSERSIELLTTLKKEWGYGGIDVGRSLTIAVLG
jgi:hypothetical protein